MEAVWLRDDWSGRLFVSFSSMRRFRLINPEER